MEMRSFEYFVILFLGIVMACAGLNALLENGLEIETSWILIGLGPLLIWLVTNGALSEFSGFGFTVKMRNAGGRPLSLEGGGSAIEPEAIRMRPKMSVAAIRQMEEQKTEALSLALKKRGYTNQALRRYLERLSAHDFFRYVIFVDEDDRFRGRVRATTLLNQLRSNGLNLKRSLETGDLTGISGLDRSSIPLTCTQKTALETMAEHRVTDIIVIDDQERVRGILCRDKTVLSMLADVMA